MPKITLIFNSVFQPITVDAYCYPDNIILHDGMAEVSFKITIPEADKTLKSINKMTYGASKLILDDNDKSDDSTLTVGNMRISSKSFYNILATNNLLPKALSKKLDPDLAECFTIQDDAKLNGAVNFNNDKIEFTQTVRYLSGKSSAFANTRTVTSSNIPFISFIQCALREYLPGDNATPGTVPRELLTQWHNKDYMHLISLGYLLHFQQLCKENNILLSLSKDYITHLRNAREKMIVNLDELLAKPTFDYNTVLSIEHKVSNAAPTAPNDEQNRSASMSL